MLRSVHDLNHAQLGIVNSALRRIENDPDLLDRSRRRFDGPSPAYYSRTPTEPPTPRLRSKFSDHEREEIYRQPLDNDELYHLREGFCGFNAESRFRLEAVEELEKLQSGYMAPEKLGPHLIGRVGAERENVMARHSIKKRWKELGVWHAKWGIPGLVKPHGEPVGSWNWLARPRKQRHHDPYLALDPSFLLRKPSWPSWDEETPDEFALRQHLEAKGESPLPPPNPSQKADVSLEDNGRESLITSRPWYQWQLEVAEEATRLQRDGQCSAGMELLKAPDNVMARWKARGDWKESWMGYNHIGEQIERPGWKWRHESPSPEPVAADDMEFSPSEIDALDAIAPPTPPPPLSPFAKPPVETSQEGSNPFASLPDVYSRPNDEQDHHQAEADPPTNPIPAHSTAQRPISSPRTLPKKRKTRQAKKPSPTPATAAATTRTSKAPTTPRRSARLAEKAQLKELEREASQVVTLKTTAKAAPQARAKRAPEQPPEPLPSSSLPAEKKSQGQGRGRGRGRPRKVAAVNPPPPTRAPKRKYRRSKKI